MGPNRKTKRKNLPPQNNKCNADGEGGIAKYVYRVTNEIREPPPQEDDQAGNEPTEDEEAFATYPFAWPPRNRRNANPVTTGMPTPSGQPRNRRKVHTDAKTKYTIKVPTVRKRRK